jgi:hypothetical protein
VAVLAFLQASEVDSLTEVDSVTALDPATAVALPDWAREQNADRIQHKKVIGHRFEHDKLDTRSLAIPHNVSALL